MAIVEIDTEKRLLAAAVFELRVQLASYLSFDTNEQNQSAATVAARFAYTLHNQALDVLAGKPIDVEQALEAIGSLEPQLGKTYVEQFRKCVLGHV